MRRAALKIAASRITDRDDRAAMTEALNRLYRAATQNVASIVADLSASERAKLAVFCYGRVHLNAVGLSIAATCDLDCLIAASDSATAGRTLFEQSREALPAEKPLPGRRRAITLAATVSRQLASSAAQVAAELPA